MGGVGGSKRLPRRGQEKLDPELREIRRWQKPDWGYTVAFTKASILKLRVLDQGAAGLCVALDTWDWGIAQVDSVYEARMES